MELLHIAKGLDPLSVSYISCLASMRSPENYRESPDDRKSYGCLQAGKTG